MTTYTCQTNAKASYVLDQNDAMITKAIRALQNQFHEFPALNCHLEIVTQF